MSWATCSAAARETRHNAIGRSFHPTCLRSFMKKLSFLCSFAAVLYAAVTFAQDAGPLKVTLRSRGGATYQVATKPEAWNPKETAIIVCDMWDRHHCPTAENRVVELAPRMNEV